VTKVTATIDNRERGLATQAIDTNQQIHSVLHYNNRKSVNTILDLSGFAMAEVLAGVARACVSESQIQDINSNDKSFSSGNLEP